MLLKLGSLARSDFLADLKISYETLVSDESGRNANGDMVLDILGEKDKVQIKTRPLQKEEMQTLLTAIAPYVLNITYMNPATQREKTIRCYTSTPTPAYKIYNGGQVLFDSLSINFIEL